MPKKRKRDDSGFVYSTDDEFDFNEDWEEEETLSPEDQLLYISHDRKQRKGKTVTLIEGFIGAEDELKSLAKDLKSHCGVGGNAKDGEIVLQGQLRDKVSKFLNDRGYSTKLKGGA